MTFLSQFKGNVIVIGFGSVAQAVVPLLLTDFDVPTHRIKIITRERSVVARNLGLEQWVVPLTKDNFEFVLTPMIKEGDFLLNLSVDVSSLALMTLCRARGVFYLDTCTEPWEGGYTDPRIHESERTNYALREEVLSLRGLGATAVITHGVNPGLISSFVKQALLNMATPASVPQELTSSEDWSRFAQSLGVKVIQISERDTQVAEYNRKKRGEFVNTWSVDGFISEGLQPAELGWGTHEEWWPDDGVSHTTGCMSSIYLTQAGFSTRVLGWTPLEGQYEGFLISHAESISIADYLTTFDGRTPSYRPTVYYAYHPCDDAVLSIHEMVGRGLVPQKEKHITVMGVTSGLDEIGVLIMGTRGSYWYGSRLTHTEAHAHNEFCNATSLQVAAGILAGMECALRNPNAGVLEPEDLDHEVVMQIARPYLGEMVGVWTEWNPLHLKIDPYAKRRTASDPLQFINFRIS